MLSDEWLSRYGLLENFNTSVTCMHTGTVTGTWTTGVTAIALCTLSSRARNYCYYLVLVYGDQVFFFFFFFFLYNMHYVDLL